MADGRKVAEAGADDIAFDSGTQLDRVNCASQVTATLLPQNPYIDYIALRHSVVTIERAGVEIFRGQAVDRRESEVGLVRLSCISDLSYLHDGLLGPFEYSGSAANLFAYVLDGYNGQVATDRRLYTGTIAKTGLGSTMHHSESGYRSAWDILIGLVDKHGGYIRVRTADNGNRVIDWLDDSGIYAMQPLIWGMNLQALTILQDATGIVNSIRATAGQNLSVLVEDTESIARFGRVRIHRNYEAETAAALTALAQRDIATMSDRALQISGRAIDMWSINPEKYAPFSAGDFARTVSEVHRLDTWTIISELKHDLKGVSPTAVTLGVMPESLTRSGRSAIINAWISGATKGA